MTARNNIALGPNSPLRRLTPKQRLGFSESQMQKKAIELLVGDRGKTSWGMAESRPALRLLYAIPNQRASKAEAGRMAGEGALAGMPDLCLPTPIVETDCGELEWYFGALYVEVKLEGEKPRKNQQAVIDALRDAQNAVVVCRSVETIVEVCKAWTDETDYARLRRLVDKYRS